MLGGSFELEGDQVMVEFPEELRESIRPALDKLRPRKDEVRQLLYKYSLGIPAAARCPPLPPDVRLKRYAPKSPPVLVQPWSVVTDVEKFIRASLRDLEWRLSHPQGYAAHPLYEILQRLAEVGVELELVEPTLSGKTADPGLGSKKEG